MSQRPCNLSQDSYRSSHETREGWSYRTPVALLRPYLLLLFIVVLLLDILLLLLFFVLFVLVNTGNSVPAVFLWPGSIIVSLHISFSFKWFGPETIEHDQVDSIINIVVCGTGDANQVPSRPYAIDINYDKVGLVPMENSVGDSEQPIGRQTNAFGFHAGAPATEQSISSIGNPVAVLSAQVVPVVGLLHHLSAAYLPGTTNSHSKAQRCEMIGRPCSATSGQWNHNRRRTGSCPREHRVG